MRLDTRINLGLEETRLTGGTRVWFEARESRKVASVMARRKDWSKIPEHGSMA